MATETVLWVDLIGYFGGGLTLLGMYRKTIIPLRFGAIGGNVGFIIFGLLVPSYPTLVLHGVLLPLNAYRTWQMFRLIGEIREAAEGDNNLNALLPYMSEIRESAGSVLFKKGEKPDRMIVIKRGTIRLDEIGVDCGPGDILGEIAAFSPDNRRTCTAICATDCDLYSLGNDAMIQLYYQNPKFGMYLMRIVVGRLLANWQNAEARAKTV
ncbi:MAG: cyclic nucleotide-binding domain-containing protein [Rhodospirillales bacterium]|nr:cyclic nucleotide-binding domain-containing protein [Rhodospirillales bacterium]